MSRISDLLLYFQHYQQKKRKSISSSYVFCVCKIDLFRDSNFYSSAVRSENKTAWNYPWQYVLHVMKIEVRLLILRKFLLFPLTVVFSKGNFKDYIYKSTNFLCCFSILHMLVGISWWHLLPKHFFYVAVLQWRNKRRASGSLKRIP